MGHRTMHYMMRKEDPNLLKTMKQNGYEVVWIGRNDFIPGSWAKTDYCDRFYDGADLTEKAPWRAAECTSAWGRTSGRRSPR